MSRVNCSSRGFCAGIYRCMAVRVCDCFFSSLLLAVCPPSHSPAPTTLLTRSACSWALQPAGAEDVRSFALRPRPVIQPGDDDEASVRNGMSNVLLLLLPRRSTHGARVVRRPPRAGGTACCTLAKASLLCTAAALRAVCAPPATRPIHLPQTTWASWNWPIHTPQTHHHP
jgi:hypothetical protein